MYYYDVRCVHATKPIFPNLVVGVVERGPVVLSLGADAPEVERDVEGGVHPAVGGQYSLVHASSSLKQ